MKVLYEHLSDGTRVRILEPLYVEAVCRPGAGAASCRYLAMVRSPDHICSKEIDDLRRIVDERTREGAMIAKADNCTGPPDFRPTGP